MYWIRHSVHELRFTGDVRSLLLVFLYGDVILLCDKFEFSVITNQFSGHQPD